MSTDISSRSEIWQDKQTNQIENRENFFTEKMNGFSTIIAKYLGNISMFLYASKKRTWQDKQKNEIEKRFF